MNAAPVRIAALSDIHGNLEALDAVLADIARRGCDAIVNLGDIVSGPLWLARGQRPRFQWVREPTLPQLTRLAHTIARRVGSCLQRHGLLEADPRPVPEACLSRSPVPADKP